MGITCEMKVIQKFDKFNPANQRSLIDILSNYLIFFNELYLLYFTVQIYNIKFIVTVYAEKCKITADSFKNFFK